MMIKTIEEAAKELASHWMPPLGQPVLGWPENADVVSEEYRLNIRRHFEIDELKAKLIDLVRNGCLSVRASGGWCLSEGSEVSESSQVDIVEARAALEGEGVRFLQVESVASSRAPAKAGQDEIRKRAALIAEVQSFWQSIEQDLSDSRRNGLAGSAKLPAHGFWRVEPAIKWATERGKITKGKAQSFIASNEESYLVPMLRMWLKLD